MDEVRVSDEQSQPQRGRVTAAWAMIVVGLVLWIGMNQLPQHEPEAAAEQIAAPPHGFESTAKMVVAAVNDPLVLEAWGSSTVDSYFNDLKSRAQTTADQLRLAMVLAELEDGAAATDLLRELDLAGSGLAATAATLQLLYQVGPEVLDEDHRATFTSDWGWFGQVALSYQQPDDATVRVDMVATSTATLGYAMMISLAGMAALVAGVVACGWALWLITTGRIQWHHQPEDHPSPVWAWVFAAYLPAYLIFGIVIGIIAGVAGLQHNMVWFYWTFPLLGIGMWWWLRRSELSSAEIRQGLGWHSGGGWLRECGAGIIGYAAGVPVVGLVVLIAWLLMPGALENSSHPLQEITQPGVGVGEWLPWFLLAAVWAPLVEETMFRGVLFHHLRGYIGFFAAALLQGVIFAAVHPQGLALIPVLGAIGVVLAAIREWRGSLIAPMVAHGVHNGSIFLVAITLA